jgi:hypothetical protein
LYSLSQPQLWAKCHLETYEIMQATRLLKYPSFPWMIDCSLFFGTFTLKYIVFDAYEVEQIDSRPSLVLPHPKQLNTSSNFEDSHLI